MRLHHCHVSGRVGTQYWGVPDPSKCSKLSMEEKREFVYEISKWSFGAPEMLQSWSRQELLQILCAEMGKERKYTGLTKLKLIENLLKIVSEKNSMEHSTTGEAFLHSSSAAAQNFKRKRKNDYLSHLPISASKKLHTSDDDSFNFISCKNLACKARMKEEDAFCKRCSCCICYHYDDNKDPSLWLICSSDSPFRGKSCGLSCHLECAFRHETSGIGKDEHHGVIDGTFHCVSCGKLNDLLGCWRKQLSIAKETRRVDILCYRVSLSQKILAGTKKYQKPFEIMEEVVKKLEGEVGPLTGLPVKTARGIVNRLSSGPEVQRMCASALELLDSVLANNGLLPLPAPTPSSISPNSDAALPTIHFEDVSATNLSVILDSDDLSSGDAINCTIWHRKVDDTNYPPEPTYTQLAPNSKISVSNLSPSSEYIFKLTSFRGTHELCTREARVLTRSPPDDALILERSRSPATNSSSISNPSSVEDETNNITAPYDGRKENHIDDKVGGKREPFFSPLPCSDISEPIKPGNGLDSLDRTGPPITPCKLETLKDGIGRNGRPKRGNKSLEEGYGKGGGEDCEGNGHSDRDFEHCVKVIRWLECEGHIDADFRRKFLTWYSLRATMREVRIVKIFVDTFVKDPASLAGQIVDTFSDSVSSKRVSVVPSGLCMKLWH